MANELTVLITGGAGFIGTHLARRLVGAGVRVRSLDIAEPRHRVQGVDYVRGDVRDGAALASAVRDTGAVFHLAAIASVPLCQKEPLDSYRTNLLSTPMLLEAMDAERTRTGRATRIIFSSTSAVYGDTARPGVPTPEEPLRAEPISYYAIQKLNSEQAIRLYRATRGIPAVVFRFFNVFGPGQDPTSQYSGVISVFSKAAGEGLPLRLNGGGVQTRDFVSVHDIARGLELALRAPAEKCDGKPMNLASGRSITIRELAGKVMDAAGRKVPLADAPWRDGDIRDSSASIARAREVLGWTPEVSLEEGLSELLR